MATSIIYYFSKDDLKDIICKSITIKEVMQKIGLRDAGGNRKTLFRVINEYGLNNYLFNLKERSEKLKFEKSGISRKFLDEDVFIQSSSYSRGLIKKRIIKDNLIEYKCKKCGNVGEWNGEKLVLQLEHINGIHNDNRLENLCFLCPNCHSQTDTYAGKSSEKIRIVNRKKIEKNNFVKDRKNYLDSIDTSKFGWIKKVQIEWNVSHTQVKRWIKKHYPEFKYFERLYFVP